MPFGSVVPPGSIWASETAQNPAGTCTGPTGESRCCERGLCRGGVTDAACIVRQSQRAALSIKTAFFAQQIRNRPVIGSSVPPGAVSLTAANS